MNYVSNFRRWKWPTAKPTPNSYCLSPGGRESFRELQAFKWKVSGHLEFDLSSIYLFWHVPLLYSSRKANEWGEGRPLPCGLESSTWAVRVVAEGVGVRCPHSACQYGHLTHWCISSLLLLSHCFFMRIRFGVQKPWMLTHKKQFMITM